MGREPRVKLIDQLIRAKHAKEIGDEFYACVIDCLMPDMNGIENVRRIRRVISEDQPIIILTALKKQGISRESRRITVKIECYSSPAKRPFNSSDFAAYP